MDQNEIKDLKMYHLEYANIANMELKKILNYTGCPKPCQYKEYKLVGEEKLQHVTQHGVERRLWLEPS